MKNKQLSISGNTIRNQDFELISFDWNGVSLFAFIREEAIMKFSELLSSHKESKSNYRKNEAKQSRPHLGNNSSDNKFDETLTKLWYSNQEILWLASLDNYWIYVKESNRKLEEKMEELDWRYVKNLNVSEFYNFLYNEYFVWKYTAPNRLATTRSHLRKYESENRMTELGLIQEQLFAMAPLNIEQGLTIAKQINGLGVAGASGLLSLLFPEIYGTVDQFVVKALKSIENFSDFNKISNMNPEFLTIKDGVVLINIMKSKATELNASNRTDYWTPRKIDKVLWTYGRN